jgi:hypothetical protein
MIRKLIARMSTAGTKAWAAFKAAVRAGNAPRTAPISYYVVISRVMIPSNVQKIGNAAKLVPIHEDHAPLYSLFTFFGLAG